MVRVGNCYNCDPNASRPKSFKYDLDETSYIEAWGEGITVFHNPNAKIKLPLGFFPDAGEIYYENGELVSDAPPFCVYSSETMILLKE